MPVSVPVWPEVAAFPVSGWAVWPAAAPVSLPVVPVVADWPVIELCPVVPAAAPVSGGFVAAWPVVPLAALGLASVPVVPVWAVVVVLEDCPLLGYAPLAAVLVPLGLVPAAFWSGWLPGEAGFVLVLGLVLAAAPASLVAGCEGCVLCEPIAVSLPAGGGVVLLAGGVVLLAGGVVPEVPAVQESEIIFTLATLNELLAPTPALAPTPPALAPTLPLALLCVLPVAPVEPAVVPAAPPVVPALIPADAPAAGLPVIWISCPTCAERSLVLPVS